MKKTPLSLTVCLLVTLSLPASAAIHYVNVDNPTPVSPYTNWATAAVTIQAAVDVAKAGEQVVVTNGVYESGGRAIYGSNRVAVSKAVWVSSVNGPEATVIRGCQVPGSTNGAGAARCVYLAWGGSLSGFTLTGGATAVAGGDNYERAGGGVYFYYSAGTISNCVLIGNAAAADGGGAWAGV